MNLLKRQYWWIWLLLFIFSAGIYSLVLGAVLNIFKADAWYTKWQYWLLGLLAFIFPFFIMITIFLIQMIVESAAKLKVDGKELYIYPYFWILGLIIPIFGWIFLIVMFLYLSIMIVVQIYRGEGEQYI